MKLYYIRYVERWSEKTAEEKNRGERRKIHIIIGTWWIVLLVVFLKKIAIEINVLIIIEIKTYEREKGRTKIVVTTRTKPNRRRKKVPNWIRNFVNNLAFKLSFKMENRNSSKGRRWGKFIVARKRPTFSSCYLRWRRKVSTIPVLSPKFSYSAKVMEYLIVTGSFVAPQVSDTSTRYKLSNEQKRKAEKIRKSEKVFPQN